MRPPEPGETALTTPPSGKALVNFHRPSSYGGGADFKIFDRENLIGNVRGGCLFQYVCDPGEHVFVGTSQSTSVVRADLDADRVYDIVVNVGMGFTRPSITFEPITRNHEKRSELGNWEARENLMIFVADEKSQNFQANRLDHTREALSDFLDGEKRDRVLVLSRDDHR